MKIGVIGGSSGIGYFLMRMFGSLGFETYFTSLGKREDSNYLSSNKELVIKCDVIILATPLTTISSNLVETLNEIYKNNLEDKTIVEVASVKENIVGKYNEFFIENKEFDKDKNTFVSLHPMFSENISSLKNKNIIECFISNKQKISNYLKLKNNLQDLGAKFLELSAVEHDKIMALVQCLNHFNVFLWGKVLTFGKFDTELIKKISSPTFRIFYSIISRYFKQNPSLYFDIIINNKYSIKIIDKFISTAKNLRQIIIDKDRDEFSKYLEDIYEKIDLELSQEFELSNKLIESLSQDREEILVAIKGLKGSYTYEALNKINKNFNLNFQFIECPKFREIFVKMEGQNLGLVPVENSVGGDVVEVLDLLKEFNVSVLYEIQLPISHCLLSKKSTKFNDISKIYSHYQSLRQCSKFLEEVKIETEVVSDNSTAGKITSQVKENVACIGSESLAKIYDLKILRRNIVDNPKNTTRFLLLKNRNSHFYFEKYIEKPDKRYIIFECENKVGGLLNVLEVFSDSKINLTKIESRPNKLKNFEYYFYIETEKICGEELLEIKEKLEKVCREIKVL